MRPAPLSLSDITALVCVYRRVIPPEFRDHMHHVNIRYYTQLFDEAGDEMYKLWGEDQAYYQAQHAGGFDLEHHVHYVNEVGIGAAIAIYARLVGCSAKRLHYVMFMVDETHGQLSAIFECVHAHADTQTRRMAAYPPALAAQINALVQTHQALPWPAPLCGSMSA